jgi:hypothetical protein
LLAPDLFVRLPIGDDELAWFVEDGERAEQIERALRRVRGNVTDLFAVSLATAALDLVVGDE